MTNDKQLCAVYETMDYGKFIKLEGNRPVLEHRKAKIMNSIDQVGYRVNPIVVNKNFEIIDGQGRFAACVEKGLPIQYVVDANASLNECIALNLGQTNWRPIDYVISYAEQGFEDYQRLLVVLRRYPKVTLMEAQGVIENKIVFSGHGAKTIKDGMLQFSKQRLDEIQFSLEFISDMCGIFKYIKGHQRLIKTGVAWVINNTNVDTVRLRKVFENKYPLFHAAVITDAFLNELSDIYNSRLAAKNCIYFNTEYKKSLKGANNE